MFQRAVASFDECNTAGVFLTGLRSQSFQSRLLFHSGIVPLPSSESLALPSSQPVTVPALKGASQPFPALLQLLFLLFLPLSSSFSLLFLPFPAFSLLFLLLSSSFSPVFLCCSDPWHLENWEFSRLLEN